MRRSICYCEPSQALAGSTSEWKFIFTTASALPKGAKLKFDLQSQGRSIDWEIPSHNPKANNNVIYGYVDNGKPMFPKAIEVPERYVPQFEFTLPKSLEQGDNFTIVMGGPTSKGKKSINEVGNSCQCNVQRRRPFYLYVDPKGKGYYEDPEVFLMDIRGNQLENIRILTPSVVQKNKRFDVVLRFEDAFGNLTANCEEGTLIELTHEHLRENLNWKLFVPETGFLTLPNIYFNEEGVYTITLNNLKNQRSYRSAPIRCTADAQTNICWGLLHGESERVDSTENIETCLRHFRDEKAMQFFSVSPFESQEETPNDIWKSITQNINEFNEDDRFTSLLGFQWYGEEEEEGLRQFIYLKDNKAILRKKDVKNNSLKKIYKSISPREVISIPSFTMAKGLGSNFEHFYPEFERVVEIYNAWGSSECTSKLGNKLPIEGPGRAGIKEWANGSIQSALKRNFRFGFVGGGLDDRGVFADFYDNEQEQYSPGITAIITDNQSREGIMAALYNRSCYATTGARIILDYSLAGVGMGMETSTEEKPGLLYNRHLAGHVAGTENIRSIEILRNAEVIHCIEPKDSYHIDFHYDDQDPVSKCSIDAKDDKPRFLFYYIRVIQVDGHTAWGSPIWLDISDEKKVGAKRAVKKK